jgi:PAS domain S-box-containing protein
MIQSPSAWVKISCNSLDATVNDYHNEIMRGKSARRKSVVWPNLRLLFPSLQGQYVLVIKEIVNDHKSFLSPEPFPMRLMSPAILHVLSSPPLQGRFIFVNKAMADIYGKKPADVVGTQPHAIVHDPQNLPRYEEMAAEERLVLEEGQEARCPERLFVDTKGVGRWFRAFKVPYRLIDGTQVWPPPSVEPPRRD